MKKAVMAELKRAMRPELINRIDDIMVFHPLSEQELLLIAEKQLRALSKQLLEAGIELEFEPSVVAMVARAGQSEGADYGARPLRRAVLRLVEDRLAEQMLIGALQSGQKRSARAVDGQLELSPPQVQLKS